MQDTVAIHLDKLTKNERDDLFTINQKANIPYESFDNVWLSITLEMDLDVSHIERDVYTFFDMLSDVGGLTGILTTLFSFLASIWNFEALDDFMVSRLFKIKRPAESFKADEYE